MSKCIYVGGDLEKTREAYDLLVLAGYKAYDTTGINFWVRENAQYLVIDFYKQYIDWKNSNNDDDDEEITLPKLRDLVVLKRNSIEDATHTDQDNWKWYIGADSYVWQAGNAQQLKQWDKSSLDHVDLKPIGVVVKEYLDPRNGYKLIEAPESEALELHASEWFLVPEGAEQATLCKEFIAFWKDGATMFIGADSEWDFNYDLDCSEYLRVSEDYGAKIIWQRHTQPEELPFIDDDPTLDKIKIKVDGDLNKAIDIAKCEGYHNCQFDKIPNGAYWLLCNEDGSVDYSMNENILNEYALLNLNDEQATKETEYLMQGKNGEKLMESIKELKNTSAWDKQEGGSHYKNLAIQPMQYALANKLDYAQANVVKYVTRHADKNGKEDLLKAIHNIELMIEHYYG